MASIKTVLRGYICDEREKNWSDGMVLTNGTAYGKEIYLGKNDSPENWHEITEEEYNAVLAEQEAENELL